ncbi:MAG: DNA repair protein RecN [Candidatus Electryonea clarkiae]|nr:DNA repair protein RecN [Candidatus Electryonea clarkiae]MDP8288141.1 DNA repair protein RecN [Candidatus Electryonea clarkiae]
MLKLLKIQNFALIGELEMKFGPGLNVITGETGAGKSILVGAIAFALGARARPDTAEMKSAFVEIEFSNDEDQISLRREIKTSGKTKAWINSTPVTISALSDAAQLRVDLTAQREGASLLNPETHLSHLDRLAGLKENITKLEIFYSEWQTLTAKLDAIEAKIKRIEETDELARFQLEEIDRFNLKIGEDKELDADIRLLEGSESLILGLTEIIELLDQGNNAITDNIANIHRKLTNLSRIDKNVIEPTGWVNDALDLLREATHEFAARKEFVQLDPEKLERLRERRSQLSRLTRKYGGSIDSLFQTLEQLRQRESGSEKLKSSRKQLKKDLDNHIVKWEKILGSISDMRHKKAPVIAKKMIEALKTVGIQKPQFELIWVDETGDEVEFGNSGKHRIGPHGWDRVEFRVSFNPGQPLKPLQNIASGGELSRVMLLLKSLHPPEKTPPSLIFDEIDTGISGRTARQVGLRLKELAKNRQVLVVTHLPQIASLADRHLVIEKEQSKSSTFINVRNVPIGGEEQVEEVARLAGGKGITDAARAGAKELINNI